MAIFEGIRYFLTRDQVNNASEIKEILKRGGAIREFYLSELVTHHISDVPLLKADIDCISVHPDWVVMSEKCGAQLPTSPFEHQIEKLFSGLVFCTSKLSRSDMEKVHVLVMCYGGKTQRVLNQNVTHLVTIETSGSKFERAQKHPETIKVVTPDWLLDSIDLGKRLGEVDYHPAPPHKTTAPTPPTASHTSSPTTGTCNGEAAAPQSNNQTKEKDKEPVSVAALSESKAQQVQGVHGEKDSETETKPAVDNEGKDTEEEESNIETESVNESVLVKSEAQENVVVDGQQHTTSNGASESVQAPPKTISTEPSLVEATVTAVGVHTQEATPTDDDNKSTVTESPRALLEGVVIYFTDYQDCMDDETIEKWKQVVVQHGGKVADRYDSDQCTHLLALHKKSDIFVKAFGDGKCIASAHWLNEVLTEQKMFPPKSPLHFPTAFKWQLPDAEKYSMSLTNYTEDERELVKDLFRIAGIPFTGHLSKENTHLICKRPEGKKYEKALEWGVPVVNGSFLSEIVHNGQVPVVLYPRHTNLGQPDEFSPTSCFEAVRLLKPWETFMASYSQLHPTLVDKASTQSTLHTLTSVTPSQPSPPSQAPSIKRTREEEHSMESDESTTKKLKLSSSVVSEVKEPPTVLFTGIGQSLVKKLKKVVIQLGGRVTDCGRECTHIVSSRVTRTVKFLSGISVCQHIVTPDWMEESGREERFIEEGRFTLTDRDAEQLFQMDVASSLARAKDRKLLEGLCFYATPSVQPPFANFKEIVECAGGAILTEGELKRRGIFLPEYTRLIVISCPEDIASNYCSEFFTHNIGVYNAEFVLTGVLRQQLDYSQNILYPS